MQAQPTPIKYMHFSQVGYSIGYSCQPSADGLLINMAEARASLRDTYNKKMARKIITGRLSCKRKGIKHRAQFVLKELADVPKNKIEWFYVENMVKFNTHLFDIKKAR